MVTKGAACPEPAEWVQPSFHGASFGHHENLVVGGWLFISCLLLVILCLCVYVQTYKFSVLNFTVFHCSFVSKVKFSHCSFTIFIVSFNETFNSMKSKFVKAIIAN